MAGVALAGCIEVTIPGGDTLFVTGTSFVVRGTAAVVDNDGPCLAWYGENGVTYHLFQTTRISNEDFDRIVTPGTTSRLEIATRGDLQLDCRIGTIAEVHSILEIID